MSDKQDSEIMLLRPLFLLLVYLSLAFAATPVQAGQVQLTWDAPLQADGTPIPNLAGYKLYYGSQSGQYPTMVYQGPMTTATMTNVSAGQTYYFAVKAYDSTGKESAFFNEVSVTIPDNTLGSRTIHVQKAQSVKAYTPFEHTNSQSDIEKKEENTKKPGAPSQSFPDWALIAGCVAGGMTLLFFMLVVIMAIFGREVPPASRFPVIAVLALGLAMTAAFIGGNAVAKGNLPVPGLQDKPVEFSIAGGTAVFIIVLFVAHALYAKHDPNSVAALKQAD